MTQLLNETSFPNSIFILDRGYSNFSFIKNLIDNNLDYCIRLNTSRNLFAQEVLADSRIDFITNWIPSEAEQVTSKKKSLSSDSIKLRVSKITLPNGQIEVLVTSLLDMDLFTLQDINKLYQLRWTIEEGFKNLKPKMKLEEFGCKRYEGVYQEFYSHIFMMNLTTLIGTQAQKTIETKTKRRRLAYKYNWSNAYKFIQNSFVELFRNHNTEAVIQFIISQIENSINAIKPNRKFVRQTQSITKHRFSPMYK